MLLKGMMLVREDRGTTVTLCSFQFRSIIGILTDHPISITRNTEHNYNRAQDFLILIIHQNTIS